MYTPAGSHSGASLGAGRAEVLAVEFKSCRTRQRCAPVHPTGHGNEDVEAKNTGGKPVDNVIVAIKEESGREHVPSSVRGYCSRIRIRRRGTVYVG
jgi:hypothetical protein